MERIDGWGQTAERRRLIRHWMKNTPESLAVDRGRLQGFLVGFTAAALLFSVLAFVEEQRAVTNHNRSWAVVLPAR